MFLDPHSGIQPDPPCWTKKPATGPPLTVASASGSKDSSSYPGPQGLFAVAAVVFVVSHIQAGIKNISWGAHHGS